MENRSLKLQLDEAIKMIIIEYQLRDQAEKERDYLRNKLKLLESKYRCESLSESTAKHYPSKMLDESSQPGSPALSTDRNFPGLSTVNNSLR